MAENRVTIDDYYVAQGMEYSLNYRKGNFASSLPSAMRMNSWAVRCLEYRLTSGWGFSGFVSVLSCTRNHQV